MVAMTCLSLVKNLAETRSGWFLTLGNHLPSIMSIEHWALVHRHHHKHHQHHPTENLNKKNPHSRLRSFMTHHPLQPSTVWRPETADQWPFRKEDQSYPYPTTTRFPPKQGHHPPPLSFHVSLHEKGVPVFGLLPITAGESQLEGDELPPVE